MLKNRFTKQALMAAALAGAVAFASSLFPELAHLLGSLVGL